MGAYPPGLHHRPWLKPCWFYCPGCLRLFHAPPVSPILHAWLYKHRVTVTALRSTEAVARLSKAHCCDSPGQSSARTVSTGGGSLSP